MFDGSTTVETGAAGVGGGRAAWRELDQQFRSLAKRRGAIDYEELALIREANEVQLWRELGMVSIREYLERRMGYTPGVASERVRVAEAEADAFGLDAAREPDGFASVSMKLSEYRKISPGALEEIVFYDHPSGENRVRRAMEWKARHLAETH